MMIPTEDSISCPSRNTFAVADKKKIKIKLKKKSIQDFWWSITVAQTQTFVKISSLFSVFFYMHRQKSGRKTEYNKTVKGS